MKRLTVIPFLFLVLCSCEQFNTKEKTLTPQKREEAEFVKDSMVDRQINPSFGITRSVLIA